MRILTTSRRSLRVLEHLCTGAIIALIMASLPALGRRAERLPRLVRWWHGRLCRALDIRIETTGRLCPGALLVANHVSWLDIPIIGSQGSIGFLSKSEVREWPLIGWMAGVAGTLFMTRGGHGTAETRRRIEHHLRGAGALTIFPEGTTTDGTRLLRFHPRLLAVGQLPGIRVQPVALRFGTNEAPDPVAPFLGDDALVPHLARLVGHPGLGVQLHFLPPVQAGALSRREIAEHCRSAISKSLGMDLPDFKTESSPADSKGYALHPIALTRATEAG